MSMMKRKGLLLGLVLTLLLAGAALAEVSDPIVTSMELTPSKITGPGPVNVAITISNSGDTDLTEPVVLYDPAAQIVSDFGTNGAALLKAGESKTWNGTYEVNQRTLDNGSVVFFVKYALVDTNGKVVDQSQPIRAKISLQTAQTDIEIKRTVVPTIAREGQKVIVRYEIMNTGTVSLLDVTIEENKDVYAKKQSIPELKPGETAEIKYPVTIKKKDLTSSATITYKSESKSKTQTKKIDKLVIKYGEPELEATLSSSAKGVVQNGTVTLTLKLKNTGSVDYSDIRVTDPVLGDVFTNQKLEAGKTLELTKEVTVPETMSYQYTINATDATGSENVVTTEPVNVTAVDPADALVLELTAIPDKTEVFEQPGQVRFTLKVSNPSNVEAKNVSLMYGDIKLYSFESLAAGASRTLSRDFALSMAGKYQFTVSAEDALESNLSFQSNEVQVAFSVPTPAPASPTPVPVATPEPTFVAATIPPITDESIGSVPKLIQNILLPVLIAAGLLMLASGVLVVIATKRRHDQKKASEAAIDQLERAKRRDYAIAAEPEPETEVPEIAEAEEQETDVCFNPTALDADEDDEPFELPHMKYARGAHATAQQPQPQESYTAMNGGYDDLFEDYDDGQQPSEEGVTYDDGYGTYDSSGYDEADDTEWQQSYNEQVYPDDTEGYEDDSQPYDLPYDDAQQPANAYDDSMFRRPAPEDEPTRTTRRSRRQQNDTDA